MKPYIFLTENYLRYTQNSSGSTVGVLSLANTRPPYTATVFLTDRYGEIINRTIDTLILQDTNIANMTVEAADASGNYSTIFTLSGNTDNTVVLKNATPVYTSSLRITIPTADNPELVNFGRLGVYGFICNLFALTDSSFKKDCNAGGYRVLNGSYIHWADYKKWTGKVKMDNLPQEQFDLLTAQADGSAELTCIPYQDLEASAIYECAVNREYSYSLDRKTELFSLELELNEL